MNTIISALLESDKMEKQRAKRTQTDRIAGFYAAMGEKGKAERCISCGKFLEYGITQEGKTRLIRASFCHLRMCPQCAWLLSRKRAVDLFKCLEEPEHTGKRFIFLTLTVKNCSAGELGRTLDLMYEGLRSWTYKKTAFLCRRTLGMVKKLEVTYNRRKRTFHPHFHILCEVPESYFTDKRLYLSKNEYAEKWRDTLGLDYVPVCDVRAVKEGDKKSVLETAKYSAKDVDYGLSLEVFKIFDSALKGRRLYTPQGSFKDTMRRLKLDPDKFDDVEEENKEVKGNEYIMKFALVWCSGLKQYRVKEIRLSDTDRIASVALEG